MWTQLDQATWTVVFVVLLYRKFINFGRICFHDDVIKWKHFPRCWPFARGIHRSPVNSPHKGQWRGALMFSLIWVWMKGWVNNRKAGDLRHYRAHYDATVMQMYASHHAGIRDYAEMFLLWLYFFKLIGPSKSGRQFSDDIFKCIFLNVNVWISIKISLKIAVFLWKFHWYVFPGVELTTFQHWFT